MASRWQNPPTAFLRVIEQDFSKETKRIAGMMLQAVITQSPVDTGAYRANHRVSVGFEDYAFDIGQVDKAGQQTMQIGIGKIAGMPTFGTLYIQNNLPYAESLEVGSSKQAPTGIYGTSFNAVVQRLNSR